MLQRVLAIVVDFLVLYFLWAVVGTFAASRDHPEYPSLGIAVFLLGIDLPLTALFGLSPGRSVAGIRVLRLGDGRAPGWRRAALRIALVTLTGPIGLLYWTIASAAEHYLGANLGQFRLWWDAAAGTELVRSTRWGHPPVESQSPGVDGDS